MPTEGGALRKAKRRRTDAAAAPAESEDSRFPVAKVRDFQNPPPIAEFRLPKVKKWKIKPKVKSKPGVSPRQQARIDEEAKETGPEPEDNRGVIHLATVPMCMSAEKLRHLMEEHGEVGRVYLAPEDKVSMNRRKKLGGNRKMRYTEGWIEFADKRVAKRIALALNRSPIGGKKRFYRDDMWNMKYLSKFKWFQLKEKAIYDNQVRKVRLEQKVSQARRENDFFLEKLQQAKTSRKIDEKRAAKATARGAAGDGAAGAGAGAMAAVKGGIKRGPGEDLRFPAPKRRAAAAGGPAAMAPRIPDISDRVLSSLL